MRLAKESAFLNYRSAQSYFWKYISTVAERTLKIAQRDHLEAGQDIYARCTRLDRGVNGTITALR